MLKVRIHKALRLEEHPALSLHCSWDVLRRVGHCITYLLEIRNTWIWHSTARHVGQMLLEPLSTPQICQTSWTSRGVQQMVFQAMDSMLLPAMRVDSLWRREGSVAIWALVLLLLQVKQGWIRSNV